MYEVREVTLEIGTIINGKVVVNRLEQFVIPLFRMWAYQQVSCVQQYFDATAPR